MPVEWLIAWLGGRLGTAGVNAGWRQAKQLLSDPPANAAFTSAFTRAVRETADKATLSTDKSWQLREGIENAFLDADIFGERADLDTVEASLTWSIHATLTSSALNSEAGQGVRQFELLAEGMAIEDLAHMLSRHVIHCIKLDGSTGGPLHGLAAQLNTDAMAREQKEGTRAVLEAIEDLRDTAAFGAADDAISIRMAKTYKDMDAIHTDYLRAFADAERMLDEGIATRELVHFLRQLQYARATTRLMAIAGAEQVLTDTEVSQRASPRDAAAADFAAAVVAYFSNASAAGNVTYFTDLIGYMEGILAGAERVGSTAPQDVSMMYKLTADDGDAVRAQVRFSRSQVHTDFKRIAKAYVAFDACD